MMPPALRRALPGEAVRVAALLRAESLRAQDESRRWNRRAVEADEDTRIREQHAQDAEKAAAAAGQEKQQLAQQLA